MQHNPNLIFDHKFHLKQVNRHSKDFSSDILVRSISDRICEQIDLLQESYNLSFDKILAINFYPNKPLTAQSCLLGETIKGEYNLIIANLNLHHENDIIGILKLYKTHLIDGGVLLATLFGGSTLIELRQILEQTELELAGGVSPRVIPMIDVKDAGQLMQLAGFKQVVANSESIKVGYKDFLSQLNHPRKMGQSNCLLARNKKYVGKKFFKLAEQKSLKYFGPNSYTSTFDIISLTGIK
jgi:hypothetical protein